MTDSPPLAAPRAGSSGRGAVRRLPAIALGLALLFLLLVAAELVFRSQAERLGFDGLRRSNARDYVCRGWATGYSPWAHSIYRHPSARPEVNENGFRGPEWPLERTPGVPRILCLGGSTTEDGNPLGYVGSYPFLLGVLLRERLGREVEVLNAGMSAWNSAEMVAAWFLDLQDYRPDLVVVHEAVNDVEPRNQPGFRRDYSHFRHAFVAQHYDPLTRALAAHSDLWLWLVCSRTPTIVEMTVLQASGSRDFDGQRFSPGTLEPYRRNLRTIGHGAETYGGTLALLTLLYDPSQDEDGRNSAYRAGIRDNNQVMRELAAEEGWLLCDLWELERERLDEWKPRFLDLVHVTPEGNLHKADRLASALIEAGFFERFPPAPAAAADGATPAGGAALPAGRPDEPR